MNVVDSCGWLEYFANAGNAGFFAPAIQDEAHLFVPTICLYEVFKRLSQQLGKEAALEGVSRLYRGHLLELNEAIALQAGQLSLDYHLPLADSVIYASAIACEATLWTQDEHFKDLPGVKYIEKRGQV
ncbi:MAG: type II toxin-antitoxin system VapC family toxin [Chloroflexi bacterium]|nr:type II toxin-antitoxin system VapC family toxin [Chloroflexota bacterium]